MMAEKMLKSGLIALCVMVASFASCTTIGNIQIRGMVESGKATPIQAACAINVASDRAVCAATIK